MIKISQSSIDNFVNRLSKSTNLSQQSIDKAVRAISMRRAPLSFENISKLRNSPIKEVRQAAEEKIATRNTDAGHVLVEGVFDNGVETLEELTSWLGIPADSSPHEIMDKMHVYSSARGNGKGSITSPAAVSLAP